MTKYEFIQKLRARSLCRRAPSTCLQDPVQRERNKRVMANGANKGPDGYIDQRGYISVIPGKVKV